MVKRPIKPTKSKPNTINSVLSDKKTSAKSKQQIDKEYYQKHKEKKKQQRKERYQQDKETEKAKQKQRYLKKRKQEELITKQTQAKYYGAEAIKILMSFKEYTELNKEKRKLWTDFNWTLKNCANDIKEGFGNIVSIMKLAQVADKLIRDYWNTAKGEIKKGKSWNSLEYDEQQRLTRYWSYEKARIENGYIATAKQLERQSQTYLKEIELAKFHEERGKKGCQCWQCEQQKQIQTQFKGELRQEENKAARAKCPECGRLVKELDEENGVCKKCIQIYE